MVLSMVWTVPVVLLDGDGFSLLKAVWPSLYLLLPFSSCPTTRPPLDGCPLKKFALLRLVLFSMVKNLPMASQSSPSAMSSWPLRTGVYISLSSCLCSTSAPEPSVTSFQLSSPILVTLLLRLNSWPHLHMCLQLSWLYSTVSMPITLRSVATTLLLLCWWLWLALSSVLLPWTTPPDTLPFSCVLVEFVSTQSVEALKWLPSHLVLMFSFLVFREYNFYHFGMDW